LTESLKTTPPVKLKALSIILLAFSLLAFTGSLFLWGQGFIFNPPPGVDLRFPITDLIVNAPASLVAAIGLWRMKRFGYVAAQFVAGFYAYASVEIFVDLWQHGAASPGEFMAILIPQLLAVIVACLLVLYLWTIQDQFFTPTSE